MMMMNLHVTMDGSVLMIMTDVMIMMTAMMAAMRMAVTVST